MSINIRKATSADAPFLAQMILQSTRADKKIGIFDLIFNTTDDKEILNYLEKAMSLMSSALSFRHIFNEKTIFFQSLFVAQSDSFAFSSQSFAFVSFVVFTSEAFALVAISEANPSVVVFTSEALALKTKTHD